jgi:hypothetical protein
MLTTRLQPLMPPLLPPLLLLLRLSMLGKHLFVRRPRHRAKAAPTPRLLLLLFSLLLHRWVSRLSAHLLTGSAY